MLVFATELQVKPDRTLEALLAVAREWILGSPHTHFTEDSYPITPPIGDEAAASAFDDRVTVSLGRGHGGEELAGLRYVQGEQDGLQWATEMVGAHTGNQFTVSVRVSCEATSTFRSLPPPKKPILVRLVLERLGGGQDGDLEVTNEPLMLQPDEVELAARAMKGELGNTLPIVYVSASDAGNYPVSPVRAAREWSGLAHVLVEPDRAFSFRLRHEADAQNAYGGAVGIYWPEGAGRRVLLFGARTATPESAEREVLEELRNALSSRRPSRECTWAYLQEAIAHSRIARLKQAGSTQVEEYVAAFDGEAKAKDAAIASAEAEVRRLRAEVRRLESRSRQGTEGSLLANGSESDLFPRERLGVVVDALKDARTRLVDESRRAHIIDDLLAHNVDDGTAESLKRDVREQLREYRSMSPKLRTALEGLGFELSDDGKHIKMVFRGDARYTFVIPKTASDHRGGLNAASQIGRTLF